ncbi:MAG TPA: polymer-forming cytoskeletal protein [Anaerolineales bacterium]|nr:polymer-forming cytoskeletal protein [Anaerolineales bacterium]HNB35579.1 polymer-forming cytoskeletal protein [Anaerolineales bacterium]HNC07171.1 polymer-forming cytoskeletal protein [Anaerolineales bacterium]
MIVKATWKRLLLIAVFLFLPLSKAQAQTPGGDVVLFGDNYTLGEGETLNGSIVVFGGDIDILTEAVVNDSVAIFGGDMSIAEDATINGDIAVFGGQLTISGKIKGTVFLMGGQAFLKESALVDGDIATFGGQVSQEPGAQITGDITNNTPPTVDVPDAPDAPASPNIEVKVNPFMGLINAVSTAIGMGLIGLLLGLFLQPQFERSAAAITSQPFVAGGFGALAFFVGPFVLVIMVVTLFLIPVAAVGALVIFLAWLFGMIALGQEVGERFTRAINQSWAPAITTGFGSFLLMLVTGLVGLVPCVGWLPSFLLSLVATGAALMTWFGTRNPPGSAPAVQVIETIPPAS